MPLLKMCWRNGRGSSLVFQSRPSFLGARGRKRRRGNSHVRAGTCGDDGVGLWGIVNGQSSLKSDSMREQSWSRTGSVQMGYRRALVRMSAVWEGVALVLIQDARMYCTRKDVGAVLNISQKKCERYGREWDNAYSWTSNKS